MRREKPKSATEDRLPPHSTEAERALLGCIFLSPVECLSECQEGGMEPEWFYDLRHGLVFTLLQGQAQAGKGLDLVSVYQAAVDQKLVAQIGGLPYLAALPDATPSSANVSYYADIVREKYQLRRIIKLGGELIDGAMDFRGTIEQALAAAESKVLSLRLIGERTSEHSIKEILGNEVIPDLEKYHRGKAQIRGLTTGIEYLDKLIGGIGGEDDFLWVFAARPGTGKTSLILDFAEWIALHHQVWSYPDGAKEGEAAVKTIGLPVGIFSMEMTRKALGKRMLFQKARADLQRWRTGFATNADLPPLIKAAGELARAPIWVDDTARLSIESAKARARRMHRQHGIGLFMWDYLQLMRGSAKRFRPDRVQELAEVTGEFQALGKELGVPNIVLAQMNRDYEKSPRWRPPQMSDLKDCGAIEQDADGIVFLYEPKMNDEQQDFFEGAMRREFGDERGNLDWAKCPRRINLLIEKCRFGPRGICELLFHQASTHFEDWNVWLKGKGLKKPALGESYADGAPGRKKKGKIEDEDVPVD